MSKIQSHKTAIHRKKPSFTVRTLERQKAVVNKVFDFGCGTGSDAYFLKSKGYKVSFWDPYFFPKNSPSDFTPHSFRTVFSTYLLNVISKKERIEVIKKIHRLLHKEGKVFFTVRTFSDISEKARKNKWKKNVDGWITKRGTFQKGFKPTELEKFIQKCRFKTVRTISKNPLIVEASV